MVDFEKVAINAFQDTFNTTIDSELGFKSNYENDSKFAYDVNKIAALAFLPSVDVYQWFDEFYLSLPPILELIMDYFEDIYVGRR
ncbi:unnamed protein product [Rotaria sp. Silwood2]|nr:unnamed protein product [Rotaria sp. Silwood2]CAF3042322.1 unnamed protein product [Rotaria sp. Silwood2]CAF3309754.1 unnamed protein product [Rotaria sp. Silwood2]CAF3431063.1 unnamed protein product [Rotaria sp. Silwood2]CAF4188423.1 unnamed protein product [Rotaria sp. Silwood2]